MPQTAAVLEQAPLPVDRRFYPDPPPGVDSGPDQLSPEGSFTGEIETGNLTLPPDVDDWKVSVPHDDMSPYGRWHQGIASDIHPTADGTLAWEGRTGGQVGVRELLSTQIPSSGEFPSIVVVGSFSDIPNARKVSFGNVEATVVATPPVLSGTKIIAARISNPYDWRWTEDVLAVDHETGVQQLIVPTSELEKIFNDNDPFGPDYLQVQYWLAEAEDVNLPHATDPVTVSRDAPSQQLQEEIDRAWEDHLDKPLPEDPTERLSTQMEVLEGFDEVLEPIPEGAVIEDPADLVVTILDQQATNNADTATVLAVSNPGYSIAQGYCNSLSQPASPASPNLSSLIIPSIPPSFPIHRVTSASASPSRSTWRAPSCTA